MIDSSARRTSAQVIPAVRPDVGPEESAAVADVLLSGSSLDGQRVAEIESHWSDYVGFRPLVPAGRRHVFHRYTIGVGVARDAIVADLAEHGVEAAIEYPVPVHRQPYVLERGIHADLPVTDAAAEGALSLPMYAGLTPDEEARVVSAVRAAVRRQVREPVPVLARIPLRSATAAR